MSIPMNILELFGHVILAGWRAWQRMKLRIAARQADKLADEIGWEE